MDSVAIAASLDLHMDVSSVTIGSLKSIITILLEAC